MCASAVVRLGSSWCPAGDNHVPEPLVGHANCNAVAPLASEPFPPGHHNTYLNLGVGQNCISEGDVIQCNGSSSPTALEDIDLDTFWRTIE